MKRIICLVLCTALLTLCSCAESEKQPSPIETTSKTTASTTTTTVATTTTTQAPELSDECDEILAEGEDENGNYYELVANETEDYQGLHIEMGVIKNNTWLMPLSEEFPLINSYLKVDGIYDDGTDFYYIGNGCFYGCHRSSSYGNTSTHEPYILNANTGKGYESVCNTSFGYYELNDKSNLIVLEINDDMYGNKWVDFLNTKTMKTQKTTLPEDIARDSYAFCFPYSEGLFAIISEINKTDYQGFYNLKGEKVIDLSEYDLRLNRLYEVKTEYPLVFVDGECEMLITNDAGTNYIVTIDKKGKVIDSEEADY